VFPAFEFPSWALRAVILLLAIGFIPARIISWVFELTPDGPKREDEIEPTQSLKPQTAQRMDRKLLVAALIALTYFAVDKFILAPNREIARTVAVVPTFAERPSRISVLVLVPLALVWMGETERGLELFADLSIWGLADARCESSTAPSAATAAMPRVVAVPARPQAAVSVFPVLAPRTPSLVRSAMALFRRSRVTSGAATLDLTLMSAPVTTQAPAVPLFAALPGTAIPVSDNEVLFIAELPQNLRVAGVDHRHVMTHDVYAALGECGEFHSLAAHAARLGERFPGLATANIERVLTNLAQRGLLQSEATVREALSQAPARPYTPLSSLAIVSAGHPAALEALLASASDSAAVRDRNFALMDLSESAEHRARKVELMAEFGRRTGQRVVLLDQKRERWLNERIAQFPEHAEGFGLLFGKAASPRARALNTIAAAYAGERALLLDDSFRLRTFGPSGGAIALARTAQRLPTIFPSTDAAFASANQLYPDASKTNLWQIADAALGKSLSQLMGAVRLDGQSLEALIGYERARIARLGLGVLGSADTEHSFWGFGIDARQHALLKTRDDVQFALSGDAVLLCPNEATLAPAIGTAACALDYSDTMGFAFGDAASVERSFAALTGFADAGAMELTLPIALERRGTTQQRASFNRQPLAISGTRFLADHISQLQSLCFAETPAARWHWLAVQCHDLAQASVAERELILLRYGTAKRAELLGQLQNMLLAAGTQCSEPWRHELLSVIQAQGEAMLQNKSAALVEFGRNQNPAEGLSHMLRQLAQAALAWSALWEQKSALRLV
jgi:hypothetical protein